jgi:hypothetical protein
MSGTNEPATGPGLQPARDQLETRDFRFELRVDELSEDGQFEGYASVFGNADAYGDVIEPGAFKKTIKESKGNVPILWQHDPLEPIGLSLEMEEDEKGLRTKGQLVLATQRGREAYELLRAKALKGLSVGFQTVKSIVDNDTGGRRLKELKLWEYSLVTFPANRLALVGAVKSADIERLARALADLKERDPETVKALLSADEPLKHSPDGAATQQDGEPAIATLRAFLDHLKMQREVQGRG